MTLPDGTFAVIKDTPKVQPRRPQPKKQKHLSDIRCIHGTLRTSETTTTLHEGAKDSVGVRVYRPRCGSYACADVLGEEFETRK